MPAPRDALEWRREQVAQGFERWSLGRQDDLLPRLGVIGIPVLWASGKRDERYGAIGEAACARLPDGRPMRFSGAGHRVPWENTTDFVREALEFRRESLW